MNTLSIEIKGGLGNIMFQIATAYASSIENNMLLTVNKTNYHGAHYSIDKYSSNILRNVVYSDSNIGYDYFGENEFKYNKLPKFIFNTKLNGYFQSEKYFKNYRNEILKFFEPTDDIINNIELKYGNILTKKTCSIHVRRGDYLHLELFHPVLPINYYKESFDKLGSNLEYLIFSDDISWCKENFDFIPNKTFVDDLEDYEEIYLMSLCNNNIIANSSFSWWGAWLNKNIHKKIIFPKVWFGNSLLYHDTSDIYIDKSFKL
jgi:hypothetical protein